MATIAGENLILHALNQGVIRRNPSQSVVEVLGGDRIDFFHRLSSSGVLAASPGQTTMISFLTEKGRLVDTAVVHVRPTSLMVLPSEQKGEQFVKWLDRFIIMEDVQLQKPNEEYQSFTMLGPYAPTLTTELFGLQLVPGTHKEVQVGGGSILIAGRQDFGINQVDYLVPEKVVETFLSQLSAHQAALPFVDEDSFDTLRTIMGIPAYGFEICDEFNPYEIGLSHTLDFSKGCYVGQEVIARLRTYNKVQRRLVGVTFPSNPELHARGLFLEGQAVGRITTVGRIPVGGRYHALAVVKKDRVNAGETVATGPDVDASKGIVYDLPMKINARRPK